MTPRHPAPEQRSQRGVHWPVTCVASGPLGSSWVCLASAPRPPNLARNGKKQVWVVWAEPRGAVHVQGRVPFFCGSPRPMRPPWARKRWSGRSFCRLCLLAAQLQAGHGWGGAHTPQLTTQFHPGHEQHMMGFSCQGSRGSMDCGGSGSVICNHSFKSLIPCDQVTSSRSSGPPLCYSVF